jgi:2,5-diketo-D-gluconate reductase A
MTDRSPNTGRLADTGAPSDRRQFLAAGAGLVAAPLLMGMGGAGGHLAGVRSEGACHTPRRQRRAGAPVVTLNNGVEMPILGLGTYQMNAADCERSVAEALQMGYRLVDTASAYRNEEAVGKGVKASGVAREELFITTKLWVTDAGYDKAKGAFERSMERLGLEYLDLYLIHQPYNDVYGAWRAMQELYKAGRIKAIGVSNFHSDRVMDLILHNEVKPAVNQIETHVFHQQTGAQAFLREQGVQMQSWAPFAEGRNDTFQNEVLGSIGEKHGKSVAQVVLRWLTQRGVVAIPKSTNPDHMAENIDVFGFELDAEDLAAIAALETGRSAFFDHRDPQVVRMIGGARRDQ